MKQVIALTGGIGVGKSVVGHALQVLGYPLYDCDSRAKLLMNSDPCMKICIQSEVCAQALMPSGEINRKALSDCVFSDPKKLSRLNEIVHGAVRDDCLLWSEATSADTLFIETAILYESKFDSLADDVWEVRAPLDLRIERVMKRSNLSESEVRARIASQNSDSHSHHKIIINDGNLSLLDQISHLLHP